MSDDKPVDESKRKFLGDTAKTIALGIVALTAGAAGGVYKGAVEDTIKDPIGTGKRLYKYFGDEEPELLKLGDAIRRLLGDNIPVICTGKVNMQAALQGKPVTHSEYIETARRTLQRGLCEAWGQEIQFKSCPAGDAPSVLLDSLAENVYLGGPLANKSVADHLGYEFFESNSLNNEGFLVKQFLPKAKQGVGGFKLRFEHFHGETRLGEFDGNVELASRWDGGNIVSRPQFAIYDHKLQKMMRCDKQGEMLAKEYLQIVKVKSMTGFTQVFIWGLHGHSLQSFLSPSDARNNLDKLVGMIDGLSQFQALIPISLQVEARLGGYVMAGSPVWEDAVVHDLSATFG